MDKDRIIELLTRKAAGVINSDEIIELSALLINHPEAQQYEEFVDELWHHKEKDSTEDVESDDAYAKHLIRHQDKLQFVQHEEAGDSSPIRISFIKRYSKRILAAASIALFMIAAYFMITPRSHNAKNQIVEIFAEKGTRKAFVLPDGTKGFLNSGSKLSYVENLGKENIRPVSLEGEAYFDVTKNPHSPFTITTKTITIKVLGTAFNVKAYPEENKTEATLIHGQIQLSLNNSPDKQILMKPNEKVEVVNNADNKNIITSKPYESPTVKIGSLSKINISNQEHIAETTWIEDRLVFLDETLEELVPKLERWYNVEIKVSDPEILKNRYTSKITTENVTELLTAMQMAKHFEYEQKNNRIIIR